MWLRPSYTSTRMFGNSPASLFACRSQRGWLRLPRARYTGCRKLLKRSQSSLYALSARLVASMPAGRLAIQGGGASTRTDNKPHPADKWVHKLKGEFSRTALHIRGVLSMARSQEPDSAGSQFFICHGNPRFLDRQYTAFGKLIKGDEVLEKIATTPTHAPDRPNKRMGVQSIKIVAADTVR